jgi:hypothetical protein
VLACDPPRIKASITPSSPVLEFFDREVNQQDEVLRHNSISIRVPITTGSENGMPRMDSASSAPPNESGSAEEWSSAGTHERRAKQHRQRPVRMPAPIANAKFCISSAMNSRLPVSTLRTPRARFSIAGQGGDFLFASASPEVKPGVGSASIINRRLLWFYRRTATVPDRTSPSRNRLRAEHFAGQSSATG